MNTLLTGFIGPLEILIILVQILVLPIILIVILVIIFRRKRAKKRTEITGNNLNSTTKKIHAEEKYKDYFPVKDGRKITLIRFNEIVDLAVSNSYVFLTDFRGKDYLVESNLTELERKLPQEFIRVHKSSIVNKNLIKEVKKLSNGRYDLVMECENKRVVSCSKYYNESIKEIIDF